MEIMRKIKILKIKPNSRFHFGKPLVDSDTSLTDSDTYLHSDVLFSALINNLASVRSKKEVDSFIKAFEDGNLKISSGFYCIEKGDGEYIFLLPKPVDAVNQVSIDDYDQIKKIKKVQFVDTALLTQKVKYWNVLGNVALSDNTLLKLSISKKEAVDSLILFSKELNTQVGLRSTKAAKVDDSTYSVPKGPYQVSSVQIPDLSTLNLKVHFYFIYEIGSEELKNDFEFAVKLLEYNGIGGERSSGYGAIDKVFDVQTVPSVFFEETNSNRFLSLSKIIPFNKEELESFDCYSHSIRGGRQANDSLLKSVRMINEGAILNKPVTGKIEDISQHNDKSYLRSGIAMLINLPNN